MVQAPANHTISCHWGWGSNFEVETAGCCVRATDGAARTPRATRRSGVASRRFTNSVFTSLKTEIQSSNLVARNRRMVGYQGDLVCQGLSPPPRIHLQLTPKEGSNTQTLAP